MANNISPFKKTFLNDPFQEMDRFQKDMLRLFNLPAFNEDSSDYIQPHWSPSLDIYENENEVGVKADIPGINKDDLDVSVEDNVLIIKGEKKKEKEIKREQYTRIERSHGAFIRSITLPTSVDTNKVKSSFKDGVLELIFSKKEEAKTKKLKISL